MKIQLDHVSTSEDEDSFQVLFEAERGGDGPYVLIQRQFEDPDGGLCYLEAHDQDYNGHVKVVRASLARNRFCLELQRKQAAEVEVTFKTTDQNYNDVARIMRIMIPSLEIVDTQDVCEQATHTEAPPAG